MQLEFVYIYIIYTIFFLLVSEDKDQLGEYFVCICGQIVARHQDLISTVWL